MRSDYRRLVCHDVERFVIYKFHGREVGLPTVGMPRCREICYILIPWSWGRITDGWYATMSRYLLYINSTVVRSDYRRLVCHDVVRSGLPDGI